jgi:hypothetical protein
LTLNDVLYIPSNPHNFLSLRCWNNAGGSYKGSNESLFLITKEGKVTAKGSKIDNHLYKMNNFTFQKPRSMSPVTKTTEAQSFNAREPEKGWEVWHQHYGHISISSLQQLLDKKLVEGFNVDTRSQKYDYKACTQAKQ